MTRIISSTNHESWSAEKRLWAKESKSGGKLQGARATIHLPFATSKEKKGEILLSP